MLVMGTVAVRLVRVELPGEDKIIVVDPDSTPLIDEDEMEEITEARLCVAGDQVLNFGALEVVKVVEAVCEYGTLLTLNGRDVSTPLAVDDDPRADVE